MVYENIKENNGTFTAELAAWFQNKWGNESVIRIYAVYSNRPFGYAEGEFFGGEISLDDPEFMGRIFVGVKMRYGSKTRGVPVSTCFTKMNGKVIGVAYKGVIPKEFDELERVIFEKGSECDCCGGFPIVD